MPSIFEKIAEIAHGYGAYLMVVTTTTHKTLRGPRGGLILTNNPILAKRINSAVFPAPRAARWSM